jgi:transcription elongation factor GreA
MSNKKQMLYTQEGYKVLTDELNYLKTVKREEIKEAIAVAKGFGDLSENAEYDEARNEQAKTEARIKELEELIENAVVVDESKLDNGIVSLGSVVTVYDVEEDEDIKYSIVGSNEANPMEGKISDQSPIGRALMGAKEGDTVVVEVPYGTIHMEIKEVARRGEQ